MHGRSLSFALVLVFSLCLAAGCDRKADTPTAQSEAPSASAGDREPTKPAADPLKKAESDSTPRALDELPDGVNAVQNEMRVLNSAMQEILAYIANDNLQAIPAQIKRVHPARQLTMKAVEQGQYKPPVNPDKMEEFEKLDNQFHDDLKALIAASKKDDLQAATDSYTDLVQGCTSCHTRFRFAPGKGPAPGKND